MNTKTIVDVAIRGQLNAIYREALNIYKKQGINGWYGLCYAIEHARLDLQMWDFPEAYNNMEYYTHVYNHKPIITASRDYWFPLNEAKPRLTILRKAIKNTNKWRIKS
jgi:hypothetical protein